MADTNIKDQPQQQSLAWTIAMWAVIWIAIYGVVGVYGGLFSSGPKDIPTGMTWANATDSASSTFYILRGDQHLILELNPHAQKWMAMLLTGLAVLMMYAARQGFQGKLKNKRKELLPPWQQTLTALGTSAIAVLVLTFGIGMLMKQQTLDLDPAADTVTLDGNQVATFTQLTGFRAYITHGSKGSIDYHLVLQRARGQDMEIGGPNAHSDVQEVSLYLDRYLADVRQKSQ